MYSGGKMWPWLLLLRLSPTLAGCPFLITEEHGALKVESSQAGAQASLPPQCAGNTLLTNSRSIGVLGAFLSGGQQFLFAKTQSFTANFSLSGWVH